MVDSFFENGGNADDMDFVVDTEGQVTSKDAESAGGGKSVHREGKYHCMVKVVKKELPEEKKEPEEGKCPFTSPSINITFEVLAGGPVGSTSHDDQVGLNIYHRIYLWKWDEEKGKFVIRSGKDLKFISQIAYGLGMITKEELDSGRFPLNFKQEVLEGRQCVVEVRNEPYDDKDGKEKASYRVPFGNCWQPTSEYVKDVKKDADAMAIYLASGDGAGGGSPNLF